jgi:hypothetical protein
MNHIDLLKQDEAVKQFFFGLPADPDGLVVELNGKAVARVTPVNEPRHNAIEVSTTWNETKNVRRCALVDREIEGMLLPEEATELALLQEEMLQVRRRLTPVPLEDLRRLHQQLLVKAQRVDPDQNR